MQAVIYCRVSTAEQTLNLSLPTQEKACRDYCKRNGFEVAQVFVERGESAKTADRPQLQALLAYCHQNKGRVQAVVVYALSRLSRNTSDHHVIRGILLGRGVSLRSATENFDDTASGRFMENVVAAVAQYDNDMRAQRTKDGMREAASRGRWVWAPPLGYRKTSEQVGPSLVHDEKTAPLVQTAFESFDAGVPRAALLTQLNALGLRGRSGKALGPQSLRNLLTNPIYVGRVRVPRWNMDAPGDFLPIVAPGLFSRVQSRLSGKSIGAPPRVRDRADFPLRRFVKCGACGLPLTGSRSKGRTSTYAYYHCRKGCRGMTVRSGLLEREFLALLERLSPRPEYMRLFRAVVLDSCREDRQRAASTRAALSSQLDQLDARIEQLEEAFIFRRAIDQETYERQMAKLRDEQALVRMAQHEAEIEQVDVEGVLAFAEHVLTRAASLWTSASLADRQVLQRTFFPDGVTWTPTGFGTPTTGYAFNYLRGESGVQDGLASPQGFEPWFQP